ncbi:hypothetical protein DC20_11285 [Rufibacter tibetensis]|uniref:Uncharacterized protein n=1 Tax=Rufibacter tibetensis TaxID=512763 RepID=A0A0P0CCI2_9BACT|nr:hypothetical protein DC20_11285 [Rufibacter tibetensis]
MVYLIQHTFTKLFTNMHKTCSIPKVVRTWALLFSVPLYMGTAALLLKEEIKDVVNVKEKNMVAVVGEKVKNALIDKLIKQIILVLP